MKIGIIETVHWAYLKSFCEIFDFGSNEISLFVNEEIDGIMKNYLGAAYSRYKWFTKDKNTGMPDFLKKSLLRPQRKK